MVEISLSQERDQTRLMVSARDAREAFEGAMRAMLSAMSTDANLAAQATRAVPFHGEGQDLAGLFLDLIADLEAQLEIHGGGSLEVTVDGVLRNRDGGYVGWGYVHGAFQGEPAEVLPRLMGTPVVETDPSGRVVIRATLASR